MSDLAAFNSVIQSHVMTVLLRRNAIIESDCARAMMLQDFDKPDRLQVVEAAINLSSDVDIPPAVASEWRSQKEYMAGLLADYEWSHGVITEDEVRESWGLA